MEYNVQDVLLVKKIDDKKRFLELAVTFAYQALVPIDRIFSAVATIEGYILRYLHQNKMVMKDRGIKKSDWWVDEDWFIAKELKDPSNPKSELITVAQNVKDEEIEKCLDAWADGNEVEKEKIRETLRYHVKGGHVEANPGMYTSSLCFDVASLYPHMIIQYNISPETKVTRLSKEMGDKAGYIESEINGVWFKREKGILPTIVKRIFDERSSFKKKMFKEKHGSDLYNYYNSMQQVRKILINSMYGVMINEYFHFYDPDLARAITRGGRRLIRFLSDKAETACKMLAAKPQVCFPGAKPFEMKNKVLSLIDTDSVTGDTLVSTSSGDIQIQELFRKCSDIQETAENSFIGKIEDINAFGVDDSGNKIEAPIKYVKKHSVKKKMFKLSSHGKTVIVTQDHSLIVRRSGKMIEVKPMEILPGDEICLE